MSILRLPGPLDPHVHLRGMDWSHKGDFATETAAALAGGYTAVLDMPNTPPETARPEALARKRRELDCTAHCDWGIYYGAHPQGNLETFPEAFQGVVGLKIYCNPTTGFMYMRGRTREEHFAAWRDHGLVAVHAEEEEVAAVLELVDRYRIRTHFCHISTRTELDMLRAGKRNGLPISAGACPHHLFLTELDLPRLGSFGMMKPPLKTQADQDALWEALSDGLLDVVESDHAPHSLAEKQADEPAWGVPVVETTLVLLGTAVDEGRLTCDRLVQLVSANPRRIFGIACPPDTWTDLRLGLAEPDVIVAASLHSKCGWTPFEGHRVTARVERVSIRGTLAVEGGRIKVEAGFGRPVAQQRTWT